MFFIFPWRDRGKLFTKKSEAEVRTRAVDGWLRKHWFVHHGIKEDLYFSLFSSPVWLILYGYYKDKFCFGHSWELEAWFPLWFRANLSNNFLGNFFWQHSWTFKETIRNRVFQAGSGMFAKVREGSRGRQTPHLLAERQEAARTRNSL